jgi:hypothetical protein
VNKQPKDDNWRAIFDAGNHWIATAVSRTVGVWEVLIGQQPVGTVANVEAARELVERVNGGGDNGERDE